MAKNTSISDLFEKRAYNELLTAIDLLKDSDITSEILRMKAYALQRSERHEEAMDVWNILIANNVLQAEYYAERGVCKFHLRFKSTLEDFDKSVELDRENPYRYACRAYIKDKLGDTHGAISDYKYALELEPDNEVTHNNLGLLEEKIGYQSHAENHFKQADALAELRNMFEVEEVKTEETTQTDSDKTTLSEVKKMLSSWAEFKRFVRDASKLLIPERNKDS